MSNGRVFGGGVLFVMVIMLLIVGVIGGVLWPYTINSWLEWNGHAPKVTFWHGFGLSFVPVVGQFSIPVAVVTWVYSLFRDESPPKPVEPVEKPAG